MNHKKQTERQVVDLLCKKLEEKEISKYKLSKLTGIAESNLSRMLTSDKFTLSLKSLIRICNAVNVEINFTDGQS